MIPSATPVTVTVWAVFQLAAVKTKLVGAAVPSLGSELATGMVTSAVGGASNFTVKVAVLPVSSVVNPAAAATVIPTGGATFRAKASELIPPSASVTVTVILAVPV